ncbi:MAG: hypothetical protein A1D16_20050 [Flavihumibacter sp. CACIAM 22H1]|nr:MAG: hypothetical protein A1D16_20050 [Flavihumibacter sp. CACIAM 22H1]
MALIQYHPDQMRYRIRLQEYSYTFIPQGKCRDTLFTKLDQGKSIKIYLFDCKGKMNVECFNKDSILIEKGSYVNSLDLLKSYYYAIDATRSKTTIKVSSYYHPLRNGVWYYYDDLGEPLLNKIYDRGIVIDSFIFK